MNRPGGGRDHRGADDHPWAPDLDGLRGKVAVVAGATRGAGRGIAAALGEAGATVVCTGRSSRTRMLRSDYGDRSETIEETAELVIEPRRHGDRRPRRPSRPGPGAPRSPSDSRPTTGTSTCWSTTSGAARCSRADRRTGTPRSGSTISTPVCASCGSPSTPTSSRRTTCCRCWSQRPGGLSSRSPTAPLRYNADHYRISVFYDLAKVAVNRLAYSQGHELAAHGGTAVAVTPGWMRSEMMLEAFGTDEETLASKRDDAAGLRDVGDSALRRAGCRRAGRGRRPGPVEPGLGHGRGLARTTASPTSTAPSRTAGPR